MKLRHILIIALALFVAAPAATAKAKKRTAKTAAQTTAPAAKGKNGHKYFIVINKKDLKLRVYDPAAGDTTLVKEYDVCLSRNKGQKQRKGDHKTPESPDGKPFYISMIQDASGWRHNFGDGRGNILAYGHWFLRLVTPGHSGIGIHGSTNNESSVPGRASEGCIRLRDPEIIDLKENYAYVGMPVIIRPEEAAPLPFEQRLLKR